MRYTLSTCIFASIALICSTACAIHDSSINTNSSEISQAIDIRPLNYRAASESPGFTTVSITTSSPPAVILQQSRKDYSSAATLVEKLIYYMDAARIALAKGDADRASAHVTKAVNVAYILEHITPGYRTMVPIKSVLFTYTHGTSSSSFTIPFNVGVLDSEIVENGLLETGKVNIVLTDAQLVDTSIRLQTEYVRRNLREAESAFLFGKNALAESILEKLSGKIVIYKKPVSLPEANIRDNLRLAKALSDKGLYMGARFALKNARVRLDEAEKVKQSAMTHQKASSLAMEMESVARQLKHKDPTPLDKAGLMVTSLLEQVKGWVTDSNNASTQAATVTAPVPVLKTSAQ